MMVWQSHLEPGDLFVDVGANVGLYTIWALDQGASVVAVEPIPDSRAQLEENAALNSAAIELCSCALAATPGWSYMTGSDPNRQHLATGPLVAIGEHVRVDTLDAILEDRVASGVKIDVEGAERLVLEGGSRALAEGRIGVLQLEWNNTSLALLGETRRPVAALLQSFGYGLCRPDSHGNLIPFDPAAELFGADVFAVTRAAAHRGSSNRAAIS